MVTVLRIGSTVVGRGRAGVPCTASVAMMLSVVTRVSIGEAVTRATGSTVQALLFLNQYVTKKGAQTSFSEYRALVTVVDTPDGWLIDQIDTQ